MQRFENCEEGQYTFALAEERQVFGLLTTMNIFPVRHTRTTGVTM
jgi:hypothetical protein